MEMTGGTSLHLKDIIEANNKNNIVSFVLSPDKNDLARMKLYLYTNEFAKEIASYKTDLNFYGQITYTNNSYKEILENIFDSFKIDILHVHHFLFQSFDAIDVANERNVYSIITLHDLYMKCPSINMVYTDKYCEFDENKDCEKCLHSRYGVNSDVLPNWQNTCYKVLKKFNKIIVPSENTKTLFKNVYKDLDIEVVEHGVKVININREVKAIEKTTFDIAFVGAMAIHKGSIILKDLIKKNNNSNIKIHLIGKPNDSEFEKSTNNYVCHGQYNRGELPELLVKNGIDLVCIFATWPETYSYTLTECYMAKVPVLSFDLGAVGDRIKKDNLGWVIDFTTDTQILLEEILRISNNKDEYFEKKKNFENYHFKSTEDMQRYYENLYNSVNTDYSISNIYEFKNYENNTRIFDFEQYQAAYGHVVHRYEMMRKTKLWKIAKKIKKVLKRS